MWDVLAGTYAKLLDAANPAYYAIPVFLILIGIESYINHKERAERYLLKDTLASLSMGILSIIFDLSSKIISFSIFWWVYDNYGLFNEALNFTILGWVLLFFLDDFVFYWHHRTSHQVNLLWAAHVNHHSSQYYNLSTALRQSWMEVYHKYLLFYIWLALLGFNPLMILIQMSISLIYQFWVHTEFIDKLPKPIEFIFNTPSHHRVHHASNVIYLDRNHGGILIIWDRLFGTFQEELKEPSPTYGITTNIQTYNPIRIAFGSYIGLYRGLKYNKGLLNKIKFLFYPPGWSSDKSTLTADEMRAELNKIS